MTLAVRELEPRISATLGEPPGGGISVAQARRGWIEKCDVVNTLGLSRLRKLVRR